MAGTTCSVRLNDKSEDICVRAYLQWRRVNGFRGNSYLQGLIALAMSGKELPVIARVNVCNYEFSSKYEVRNFVIFSWNPYYEQLSELGNSYAANLIHKILHACIKGTTEEEWFMSETELALLLNGDMDTVRDYKPQNQTIKPVKEHKTRIKPVVTESMDSKENTKKKIENDNSLPKKKKGNRITFGMDGF